VWFQGYVFRNSKKNFCSTLIHLSERPKSVYSMRQTLILTSHILVQEKCINNVWLEEGGFVDYLISLSTTPTFCQIIEYPNYLRTQKNMVSQLSEIYLTCGCDGCVGRLRRLRRWVGWLRRLQSSRWPVAKLASVGCDGCEAGVGRLRRLRNWCLKVATTA
jgi:hypothetical protein